MGIAAGMLVSIVHKLTRLSSLTLEGERGFFLHLYRKFILKEGYTYTTYLPGGP